MKPLITSTATRSVRLLFEVVVALLSVVFGVLLFGVLVFVVLLLLVALA